MRFRASSVIAALLMQILPVQAQSVRIGLQPLFSSGLNNPVYLTNSHDGSNRLFIIEQPGIVSVIQPISATRTTFLDISGRVLFGGEQGLLGLAFHPQFAANGRFFGDYTRQPDGATVIAEYHVSPANPNVADVSERVLLVIPQPYVNHNGGMIEFGPDGYLYIGMGDGGSANDPENRAQNTFELLGKILRIDVDHQSPPSTNPYADGRLGRPEIYAIGMRNPFRFSFDLPTGQLYVGDVGQDEREEVDNVALGGNYGWRTWEGTRCTNLGPAACSRVGYTFPIAEYDHATNGRCSIIGGYVYRGAQQSLPYGAYIYGDYCSGEIFMLQAGVQSVLTRTTLNITSFGQDETGELYVLGQSGSLFRITSPDATNSVSRTFNVSAHGSLSLANAGMPAPIRGYTRIQAVSRPNGAGLPMGMAIVGNRHNGVLVSESAIPSSPLISSGRIYVEIASSVKTGIAIANPNSQPVTLNFYFTDGNGSDFGQGSTTIDGNQQLAAFLDEPPFSAPAGVPATFTFSSSLLVSATAMHGFANQRNEFVSSTIPVAALSGLFPGTATIAQFADGGGWKTRIVLINPSDVTIGGSLTLYAQNGLPLTTSLNSTTNSTVNYSIPPRAVREFRSGGASPNVQIGSISIVSNSADNQPAAFALFQFAPNGITVNEASDFTATGFAVNVFVESQGTFAAGTPGAFQSAIAVTNPFVLTLATLYHFELYASDGTLLGTSPVFSISGHSQLAMFLEEIPGLPAIPPSFQGVLRIVGSTSGFAIGEAVVTAFRARYNERGDFLMTPTPPKAEVFTTTSSELLFPHFVVGGGYETQFVLFSDSGASGTMYFFDQDGNLLTLPVR